VFYNGVRLGDILAFGFGLNDAGGNHSAGSPVKCIVRHAGDAAGAAAIASADATHLTHANLPVGLYEYVFSVSADTYSVSAGENYLVYAYASASGLSTVACVGGFRIAAPAVNLVRIDNASATAAMSAIAYVAALSAVRSIAVLSADSVSVVVKGALTDYDVPTSADVSVIVANGPSGSGVSSAQVSVIVKGVLADYDVPTSADVSAIVDGAAMTSASASSLFYIACLSAVRAVGVLSAQAASVVAAQALADYDVPTSADVSALVSTVGFIANLSALRNVGVLSAQAASVVAKQALTDYDVPTSADVSVILVDRLSGAWKVMTIAEPAAPVDFASVTPAGALSWLAMLATNRMVQTSAKTIVQNAAGTEIASASVAYDGTTFTRGPWVG
jgi:hypothetical protein